MYQQALVGYENALGPNQGKPAEAEAMIQRALTGCEKALGVNHQMTLEATHNLGTLYAELIEAKLAEAEAMFQRALAGFEKALGLDYTFMLHTVHNLGTPGQLAEAEAVPTSSNRGGRGPEARPYVDAGYG